MKTFETTSSGEGHRDSPTSGPFYRGHQLNQAYLLKILSDAAKTIDSRYVKGEPGTGYEGPKSGEFSCRNCTYSDEDSMCNHPVMLKSSRQPLVNGKRKIDPKGCCEYVDRKGQYKL